MRHLPTWDIPSELRRGIDQQAIQHASWGMETLKKAGKAFGMGSYQR